LDLPGPGGKRFDYLTIDEDDHYLLSAHLAAGQHQWRRRIYISFILVGTSCTGAVSEDRPNVQVLVRPRL